MSRSARALIGLPVEVEGRPVGRVVDVALDRGLRRLLGLDVQDAHGRARFLPAPAATLGERGVATPTALALLDRSASAFYDECGIRLGELERLPCEGEPIRISTRLVDAELADDGDVQAIVLRARAGETRVGRERLRLRLELGGDGLDVARIHLSGRQASATTGRAVREVSPAAPGVPPA